MAGKCKHGVCCLCGRHTELTFHHLVPRKVHRRKRFRKRHDRATLHEGIDVCRLCHRGIHRLYDELTLARRLNTLASLCADPAILRHIGWVRKQRVHAPDD